MVPRFRRLPNTEAEEQFMLVETYLVIIPSHNTLENKYELLRVKADEPSSHLV